MAYQATTRAHHRPRSSRAWCDYFRHNGANLLPLPWDRGAELTDAERDAVAASLQSFQLGESSQGRHLLRCAADHASRTGDPAYLEATRLFLAEEHRHSRTLARFLDLHRPEAVEARRQLQHAIRPARPARGQRGGGADRFQGLGVGSLLLGALPAE